MLERIVLRSDQACAEVVPRIGGGLARFDLVRDGAADALLRPLGADAGAAPLPSQLACFPLVPWSNRMAPGGFEFDGQRHVPQPKRAGEPCPIHGDGWLHEWTVVARDEAQVTLALSRSGAVPFSYSAELRYALAGAELAVHLSVRNEGAAALPFGLGLHPWMPYPQEARLRARARTVWLAGTDKLPRIEQPLPVSWTFDDARPLPDGVDNVFTGWNGRADIAWPARSVALEIEADMDYFILYVPPGRDFFCVEPVDHLINAHNMPGRPGLTVLAPGEQLRRRVTLRGRTL